jgi:quaternary ammonium compound-resistance protein SugE
MAWVYLCIAGLLEIAFAFSMKASEGFTRLVPALLTFSTGLTSVFLLSLALRTLPVGSGYAVWTGIGAAGTAIWAWPCWATPRRQPGWPASR